MTLGALHALCANLGHPDVEDFSSRIKWIEDGDRIFVSENTACVRKADETGTMTGMPGGLEFKVLSTPGHTAGGVCYLCREVRKAEKLNIPALNKGRVPQYLKANMLAAKTITDRPVFAGCIGRSDLPGGDYTALMQGIFTKLLCLDGGIDVLPGHGPATTISEERMKNPFLQPFNEPYEE